MNRFLNRYCKVIEMITAILMAGMVILVFGNVVLRYFFSTGVLIAEELSRWMFVWMVFIGAIVVIKERGHLGTDMVVARLPAWGRRLCLALAQMIMIYITWLMLVGSWEQVLVNNDTEAPVSRLPVSVFYFSGVMFAASAGVMLIWEWYLTVSGKTSDHDLIMIQESEELALLDTPIAQESQPPSRTDNKN